LLNEAAILLADICRGAEVFEFGSGGSTLWLAGFVKKLVSIEDDHRWYKAVSSGLAQDEYDHAEVRFVSTNRLPDTINGTGLWDVVFVDCRTQDSRRRSIIIVARHVKVGGWLVADDYNFPKTQAEIDKLRDAGWDVQIISGTKTHPVRKVPVKTSTAFCRRLN